MAVPVIMPRQGQSVESCILGEWYRQVGEQVKTGDILFSYETDKATFEEEAKADGELLAVFYREGDEVPVLTNIAVIGKKGENTDEFRPAGETREARNKNESFQAEVNEAETQENKALKGTMENDEFLFPGEEVRIKISPLAKAIAKKSGVSYEKINGTGPNGRIIAKDIEAIMKSGPKQSREQAHITPESFVPEPGNREAEMSIGRGKDSVPYNLFYGNDYEEKKISRVRGLIAKTMHTSLQNSAQLTHHMSADARNILSVRKQLKKDFVDGRNPENITINDLVCYAVIRALKKWPQVNTHFLGESMRWFKKIHLGIAVDTERGLIVPVVRNADDLSVRGLSSRISTLAAQCRNGNINPELLEPEAATFTVSNLGNYGVEMFTPVINLPQTAILGVCTIVPRPKDLGDGVYGFVPMIGLSLTYDHQALDGGEATLFLAEIKNHIENIIGFGLNSK
ncbi:dihydrolipoamide acetyltransferase family protein [Mariniphaga sediminis]|uniref:dihydrolipoamide acetyltransferase family protein n=1 Tax=Mariniphaga sediminis TaxID=1628158 RepID=UPI003562C5ED